jgi:hypothetical protein
MRSGALVRVSAPCKSARAPLPNPGSFFSNAASARVSAADSGGG